MNESKQAMLAKVAAIICEATCGLTSECRSREAAQALLDNGFLRAAPQEAFMSDLLDKLREAFQRKRYGASADYDPDFDLFDAAADAIEDQLETIVGRAGVVAPALVAAIIERCAKIADPWPGYWIDHSSTEAECAVVAVRTKIAAKIRAMAVSSTDSAAAPGSTYIDEDGCTDYDKKNRPIIPLKSRHPDCGGNGKCDWSERQLCFYCGLFVECGVRATRHIDLVDESGDPAGQKHFCADHGNVLSEIDLCLLLDERAAEIRALIAALEQIARLAPEEKVIPLDRAFATVREMASIARNELSHHATLSKDAT
jgi:hypothetical protein